MAETFPTLSCGLLGSMAIGSAALFLLIGYIFFRVAAERHEEGLYNMACDEEACAYYREKADFNFQCLRYVDGFFGLPSTLSQMYCAFFLHPEEEPPVI